MCRIRFSFSDLSSFFQLSLVSFLAVSFRDGKAPAKLIQENLIGPLLKNGDGVKIKSENSGALSSWKFKNFDLERWEESQKVELKDEDGNLYFRSVVKCASN